MERKIKLFEDFTEAEKKDAGTGTKKPWDVLVVGDVYSVYDMENNGKVLHQSGEFLGEKGGKLQFKSVYQAASEPYLIDKNDKYVFTKKSKPKGK